MNPANIFLTFGIIFGLVVLYFDTFVRTGKNLFTYEGSHGLLILAVSLYLIWKKREALTRLPVRPNLVYGTLLTAFGCFMFLSGKLSSTQLLQQVSLVPALLGIIYLILGYGHFRALLVPMGYIIFLFNFFEELFSNVSIHLQTISAWIAFNFLKPTGWPIFLKDQVIELPHISLEVARACNGINHIIALVALAVPLAIMTQRTLARKISLILIGFLIGIFANGLRIALIGIWSYFNKDGPLHGPFDTLYVSFIFFFGMGLLLLISRLTGNPFRTAGSKLQVASVKGVTLTPYPSDRCAQPLLAEASAKEDITHNNNFSFLPRALPLAFLVGIFILASSISFSYFYKPKPAFLATPLHEFPMTIGEWTGKDIFDFGFDSFEKFSADVEIRRIYTNHNGKSLKLYIGYFTTQEDNKKMVNYRINWLHDDAVLIPVALNNGNVVQVKKKKLKKQNIYFWYEMNGQILLNHYKVKLTSVIDAFVKRRNNGAFISVFIENNQKMAQRPVEDETQFIVQIFPYLKKHLQFK